MSQQPRIKNNVNPGQMVKSVQKVRRHEQGNHVNYGKQHDAQRDNPQSLNPKVSQEQPTYSSQNYPKASPLVDEAVWVTMDDGEADMHKLVAVADIIKEGGVGIIPTDTYPAIVCDVHNAQAVDRLYSIKHLKRTRQLSLLCRNLADVGTYTAGFPAVQEQGQQSLFPLVKENVPGPFTFLLPASKQLPKQSLPYKNAKSRYRKTVGVRLPDHPVCHELLEQLEGPLLCTSCHVSAEGDMEEVMVMTGQKLLEVYPDVDFIVDPGETWINQGSTVLDFTTVTPQVLRLGAGDPRVFSDFFPTDQLDYLEVISKGLEEEELMV